MDERDAMHIDAGSGMSHVFSGRVEGCPSLGPTPTRIRISTPAASSPSSPMSGQDGEVNGNNSAA